MDANVYKSIEVTGSSPESTDEAIRNAITKCAESVRNMDWFEVVQTRGYIDEARVRYWQVTIKIGFRLED